MKKIIVILSIISTLILGACGNEQSGQSEQEQLKLKLGNSAPETDPTGVLVTNISNELAERTDNAIEIEIFHGGQLGGEVEMVEQVRSGTIDMAFVSTGAFSNFSKDFAFLDLPFLFKDEAHAQKVLNGEVGDELKQKALETDVIILQFFDNGIANIATKDKPIYKPEDLKGVKLRTLENAIFTATFKTLGASPIAIPYPEFYTSLQQGIVDGSDPLHVTMVGGKIYELAKKLSKVGISYRAGILIINKDTYESLSNDLKDQFNEVIAQQYDIYKNEIYPEYQIYAEDVMTENGVEIIEADQIDIEAFKQAVQPVYDEFYDTYSHYLDKIMTN